MGCSSTKKPEFKYDAGKTEAVSTYNNPQSQSNKQQNNINVKGGTNPQQPQIHKQISVINRDYPLGKAILLRKIQGTVKSLDNLKQLAELFINLTQVPSSGNYNCTLVVTEEKMESKKIASFSPQSSDSNGQVLYGSSVEINYYFEKDQKLEIRIQEINSGKSYLLVESIGNIASYSKKSCIVKDPKSGLTAELKMQPIKSEKRHFNFGVKVEDSELNLSGQTLYVVFKNFNDNKVWRGVYKTEESKNNSFDRFTIAEDDLFLGDSSRNFRIELYCHSNPHILGYCETSINMIIDSKSCQFTCPQTTQLLKTFLKFDIIINERFTFLELLNKGLQISMMVGVDFTASNGETTIPGTLHYIGGGPNQYERAIRSCGTILAYYDHDQLFPLLGFGGVPQGKNTTEFVFPLNFNEDPNVKGIDQMIEVYKRSLTMTTLSGPTNFAPLLNNLCKAVKNLQGVYTVMMILTDGIISDIEETVDAIIQCSLLPISLIIIGVGTASFDSMEKLDGDEMPLTDSHGRCVARDCVQFVPFLKYEKNTKLLAEEVLKELPSQIEQFYLQSRSA